MPQGLAPLDPRLAALAAGRLVIKEINRVARARADFAFEHKKVVSSKEARECRKRSPAVGYGWSARTARKVARANGTPVYVWENGKVVAKRP